MIHPINIPEDLLEHNPRMPSIFEPRKKLKISYTDDGRRLNADGGTPLNAASPNLEWKNFFLRSFVRRLACEPSIYDDDVIPRNLDAQPRIDNDEAQTSASYCDKAPPHIDIIDLQPNNYCGTNENESISDLHAVYSNAAEPPKLRCPVYIGDVTNKDYETPSVSFQRASSKIIDDMSSSSSDDESTQNAKAALISFGQSARLPRTRHISARVSCDTLKPLIAPCCANSISHNRIGGKFKEFARFDFSHSNFFANDMAQSPCNDNSHREHNARRKCSIEMIPNSVGSRVWTNSQAAVSTSCSTNHERLARCHSTPPHSDIIFSVLSVSARRQFLEITMNIRNTAPCSLTLLVIIHVHEVENEQIGLLVNVSYDSIALQAKQELQQSFHLDIYAALKSIFNDKEKYPLVTLHGRVVDF